MKALRSSLVWLCLARDNFLVIDSLPSGIYQAPDEPRVGGRPLLRAARPSRLGQKIGSRSATREPMEEKRPLRRQPENHHFWSLIMLAVTAGAFLLVVWVVTKALFFLPSRVSNSFSLP